MESLLSNKKARILSAIGLPAVVLASAVGGALLLRPSTPSAHADPTAVVPSGWIDNATTQTLKAPNGIAVTQGYRWFVEHNLWDSRDWPVENETAVSTNGHSDGSEQSFVTQQLRWQPSVRSSVYRVGSQMPSTISGFTPTNGPAGTTVTITGHGFFGATNVLFNGIASPKVQVQSATTLTATVPTGATSGSIQVSGLTGNGTPSSATFTVGAATNSQPTTPSSPAPAAATTTTTNPTAVPTTNPQPAPSSISGQQAAVIPVYWTATDSNWQTTINTAPAGSMLVVNNGNGPGSALDPNLVNDIKQARAKGLKVLGYVLSSQGTRSQSAQMADIDTWYSRYPLDGIFIDDLPGYQSGYFTYYQGLYNYVKAKSGSNVFGTSVMLNGASVPSDQRYMQISDVLSTYESTASGYTGCSCMASWMSSYPASHFAAIVYGASGTSAMQSAISASLQRRNQYVYVSDRTSSIYEALPSYWSAEVSALTK